MWFTSYSLGHAFVGGVLIGLASLLGLLATGKPPGISGVFSRALWSGVGGRGWRIVFLLGLLAGAMVAFHAIGSASLYRPVRSVVWMVLAGVLVGFGTRFGGGCTSGHGVCGLSLGSKGSLVATLLFMGAAMVTVFIFRLCAGS